MADSNGVGVGCTVGLVAKESTTAFSWEGDLWLVEKRMSS
jgi:hypothetical protein